MVILDALLERLPADRLVAVAIPDYTVTPGRRRVRRSAPAPRRDRGRQRRHGRPVAACAGSAGSTSSTCRGGPPTIRAWWRAMGSTRVEPSTPCGSSGSSRSWRAGSRADRPVRRFARSPEHRPGNEAPASLAIGQQPHDRPAASARPSGRPVHPDRTTDGGHPMASAATNQDPIPTRSIREQDELLEAIYRAHAASPARSPAEVDARPGGRRRSRQRGIHPPRGGDPGGPRARWIRRRGCTASR